MLIHGFPLSGASWERQVNPLLEAGHRVITYDRRGFGSSSRPTIGYDCDMFTSDLHTVTGKLDLRDAVLVGFSMGTGEVTRYLATHGSSRVRRAVLLAPVPPFLPKTGDTPEGVPQSVFDGIMAAMVADRPAYLRTSSTTSTTSTDSAPPGSATRAWQLSWNVAAAASAYATLACVPSWLTDFRDDLAQIDIPVLAMQATRTAACPSTPPTDD